MLLFDYYCCCSFVAEVGAFKNHPRQTSLCRRFPLFRVCWPLRDQLEYASLSLLRIYIAEQFKEWSRVSRVWSRVSTQNLFSQPHA